MTRASDVTPGEFQVEGFANDDPELFGGVPVTLLVNVPGSVEMRFGSTEAELLASDWQNYAAESRWWMPVGVSGAAVYGQFRDADGNVGSIIEVIPDAGTPHTSATQAELPVSGAVTLPFIGTAVDYRIGTSVWSQGFDANRDGWSSSDGAGRYFAASWDADGYVWTAKLTVVPVKLSSVM